MGSSCCKPGVEDSLSGSGNNQPWTASSSLSVSNYGGYTTRSDPSTTPVSAGPIINNRAGELGRAAGYAEEPYASSSSRHAASRSNSFNDLWLSASYTLPPYVSSSNPPTNRRSKTNELAGSSGYALEPYASSSSRHAASRSNSFSDLWLSASYTLPPFVSSSTAPTTRRSKSNELARSSGYAHPGDPPITTTTA